MFNMKNILFGLILAVSAIVTILFTKEGAEIFIYNIF